jgi:Ca2+/H+ antiporter
VTEHRDSIATFRLAVAVLIVVASCLGAGVAWGASTASTHSSDLDQAARQQFLLKQQILTSAQATIGEELRRVVTYQEEIESERILEQQAGRFRRSSPAVAAILDQQAQGQAALARTTGALFFATTPTVATDGTVSYDRRQALANLLGQYVVYEQLHPAATQAAANHADKKYRHLIGVGVLLVAALFFLTIAEIGVRRVRHAFAVLGALALLAGAVLWPLVETSVL